MPRNEVSLAELQRMQANGAEVVIEPDRVHVPEVVEQLVKLVEKTNDNDPILEAVGQITEAIDKINLQADAVNMEPVADAILALRETVTALQVLVVENRKAVPYKVDFERDQRQLLQSMTLRPLEE